MAATVMPRAALLLTISSSPLLPLPCLSVRLDVHVPLPRGCVEHHALLANRLLREASNATEVVNLFHDHAAHVTLYLADFDLETDEVYDSEATSGMATGGNGRYGGAEDSSLNRTKVDSFLGAISSIDLGGIVASAGCSLSLSTESSDGTYYAINGDYTMLRIEHTACLQDLSDALLHSLKSYLRRPVIVPSWVADLPEPGRSAGIYRSREYGSPNVLEGFEPHVTVGFDPMTNTTRTDATRREPSRRWRIEAMERWEDEYRRMPIGTCADDARGIALGVSSVGGTVLANSRMGYWEFANGTKEKDEVVGVGEDDNGPSRDGQDRDRPSYAFG
jgi:hypothetical protein